LESAVDAADMLSSHRRALKMNVVVELQASSEKNEFTRQLVSVVTSQALARGLFSFKSDFLVREGQTCHEEA
jgi:hypothetical protein